MSNSVESSEQRLLARLRALPRKRAPTVDLWPSIQARLGRGERHSPWWSQAVAAALVAGLGLAVMRIGGQHGPSAGERHVPVAWQINATGAELEYSGILRDMRGLGLTDTARVSAGAGADFVASLQLVDEASRQVRAAIDKNPDASYLTGMLATLHRKRLGVLRDLALSSLERDQAPEDIDRRA